MRTVPDANATPLEVRWGDVAEFEQMDERVAAVSVLFGTVIGVSNGSVQWCTDSIPPAESERLAWLWMCWPDLDEQIMNRARQDHRELMRAYRAGQLSDWWSRSLNYGRTDGG
jgi:hypothetical protein